MAARPDLYISADVEADGPIPGPYSMLSFGLVVAGTYDGTTFAPSDGETTFCRELQPISDAFDPEALAVSGLDREALAERGADPVDAMREARAWVEGQAAGRRTVLVAYPLAYDWMWLHWYFERFADGSPFGHGSSLDIRSFYMGAAGTIMDASGKAAMPPGLIPEAPHTHDALDDAREQAELFANVFAWALAR